MVPGRPIPKEYFVENLAWLEDGMANVIHHINIIKKAGINPVVCINRFHTDTEEEIKLTRRMCEEAGARVG